MRNLIYYPYLEPPDREWLKFALLYFEEFQPIIPYGRRNEVTDLFQRIMNETDLVKPFSPDYEQGQRASIATIDEAEKIFARPAERSFLFHRRDILTHCRASTNWTSLLYREKFSYGFLEFCKENRLGHETEDGILMSEELCFMFMTNLAKEISFDQEASIITDNLRFDNYTSTSRALSQFSQRKENFAKGILNLLVPGNLSDLPLNTLIRFRQRNREGIRVFNEELLNVQDKIGRGLTRREFIDSFNDIYSEFSRQVILQGIGVSSIPFAAYVLITNQQALAPEYAKEVLGALGIVIGGMYSLKRLWIDQENKRYCKKYLLNLQRLK